MRQFLDIGLLGVFFLHVAQSDRGCWNCMIAAVKYDRTNPESNIDEMLTTIESLLSDATEIWNACKKREFNVGCKCGEEPRVYHKALSNETLFRMAQRGATFRLRLHPAHSDAFSENMRST